MSKIGEFATRLKAARREENQAALIDGIITEMSAAADLEISIEESWRQSELNEQQIDYGYDAAV